MSNNANNANNTKYTLLVPFEDKNIVKSLGAKWDSLNKNRDFVVFGRRLARFPESSEGVCLVVVSLLLQDLELGPV
jgi:hypothetical protein